MEFYKQPEVSWNKWFYAAMYNGRAYTRLGEYIASKSKGGVFVDAPCGNTPDTQYNLCHLAHTLGIATYIEIDNDADVLHTRLLHTPRMYDGMQIQTYCADIAEFFTIWKKAEAHTAIIYISGLQPDQSCIESPVYQAEVAIPYLRKLYDVLESSTTLGDIVVINDADALVQGLNEEKYASYDARLALIARGFTLRMHCMYGKVYVYEKIANT